MVHVLWPNGAPLAKGMDEEDQPRLVPYLIKGDVPRAAVIVCPGGGYTRRAAHEGEPVALWLNELGINAFVLHYRVAPYTHPAPLLDAQRAIRTVRHNAQEWGVDPGRVGILGFSAGGHLASTAGTHFDDGNMQADDPIERCSSRPDAMILCYAVISLGQFRHTGSFKNLLGEDAPEQLVTYLSSELQVTEQTPPTFLWTTSDDASVPVENSLLFAAALRKHKVPFDLHCYESGRHGIGLAHDHAEAHTWTQVCALWLTRRGFCG